MEEPMCNYSMGYVSFFFSSLKELISCSLTFTLFCINTYHIVLKPHAVAISEDNGIFKFSILNLHSLAII